MATGMSEVLAGRGGGPDHIRAAVPLLQSTPELRDDPRRLAWLLLAPLFLRDAAAGDRLRAIVDEVRRRAGVGVLPALLFHVARDQATRDQWPQAQANYAEAIRLARETGQSTELAMSLAGLAWLESRSGHEAECRSNAAEAAEICGLRQINIGLIWVEYALGDLELALGHAEPAVRRLTAVGALLEGLGLADPDLMPAAELVDALMRSGRPDLAVTVADDYAQRARAKGQPWSIARAERALGMVAADHVEAAERFEAALTEHGRTVDVFEVARTRLAYGERLRRAGRRTDARPQLRLAVADFDRLGATCWADRASTELTATGGSVRRSGPGATAPLTSQELQVSLLLAEGRTTRETAAALFLSPKTVEYHLRKVYNKLGIRSRSELAAVLTQLELG